MRRNNLILDAFVVVLEAVISVVALKLEKVLHGELLVLVPSYLEAIVAFAVYLLNFGSIKEVINLLVINLQE